MTASLVLANGRLVLPDRIMPGSVAVSGDRIDAVLPRSARLPSAERVLDLHGAYLAPGFVDIHLHGSVGVDVMTAGEDELARMAGWLATCGVTRFLPTLIATTLDQYRETTARIARWIGRTTIDPPAGAVPLGIHFEGPFVNRARCGALHPKCFLDGSSLGEFFDAVGSDRLDGLPSRLITVAPEIDGGLDVVRECVHRSFVVSIGHTEAGFHTLDSALDEGARHMTHFMNAMSGFHHRSPGPVGWGLLRKNVTVDAIADFEHLHPDALRLLLADKTANRVALISDAVAPAGLGDGEFEMWGERVTVTGTRTSNANGSIAGSVISLRDAVRNMASLGTPLLDVVRMASTVPARVLGLDALGAIAPGKIADFVAFREELEPFLTVVGGRVVCNFEPLG